MMELVHSALLNFVKSNFHEGVDNEIIAKHAADFFDEKSIVIAKTAYGLECSLANVCLDGKVI
jgi:hypothetical protein